MSTSITRTDQGCTASSARASRGCTSLLVEAGFTPVEAIQVATLNGARYLGRDASIGTVSPGKQADLVVVNGNPTAVITEVRKVEIVFRQGIGYDPAKLISSVAGRVGLF